MNTGIRPPPQTITAFQVLAHFGSEAVVVLQTCRFFQTEEWTPLVPWTLLGAAGAQDTPAPEARPQSRRNDIRTFTTPRFLRPYCVHFPHAI